MQHFSPICLPLEFMCFCKMFLCFLVITLCLQLVAVLLWGLSSDLQLLTHRTCKNNHIPISLSCTLSSVLMSKCQHANVLGHQGKQPLQNNTMPVLSSWAWQPALHCFVCRCGHTDLRLSLSLPFLMLSHAQQLQWGSHRQNILCFLSRTSVI